MTAAVFFYLFSLSLNAVDPSGNILKKLRFPLKKLHPAAGVIVIQYNWMNLFNNDYRLKQPQSCNNISMTTMRRCSNEQNHTGAACG
ncbi:hypothetical protein P40081_21310 [Paenibacillus sp. FSL P4-0081]|jgi:hypothetical protein|nr:hypothetical protein P40081_21310 [Paenibacillus sp. FSL P4-0081]OMF23553.1 hypothetical protein BK132_25945 [Paenibacillus sp. FSL H8-0259]